MIFLIAVVLPALVILSPLCANMRTGGKAFTFLILSPVVLFLCALIQVSMQSPEEQKANNRAQAEREVKEKMAEWDREAKEKALKDFHNAMRPYQ